MFLVLRKGLAVQPRLTANLGFPCLGPSGTEAISVGPSQQLWFSLSRTTEGAFLYVTPQGFQAFYYKHESLMCQNKKIKLYAIKTSAPKTEASPSLGAKTKNGVGLSPGWPLTLIKTK